MKMVFSAFQVLFFVFMALFLIGGVCIILTQTFGIVIGSGDVVSGVENWLAPVTFSCATLCAVCAFVLTYRPKSQGIKH